MKEFDQKLASVGAQVRIAPSKPSARFAAASREHNSGIARRASERREIPTILDRQVSLVYSSILRKT